MSGKPTGQNPLPKRGAMPTPSGVVAGTPPHTPTAAASPNFYVKPIKISAWGNVSYPPTRHNGSR